MLNQLGLPWLGNGRYINLIYCLLIAMPIIIYLFHIFINPSKKNSPSVAFFYGNPVPVKLLSQFDRVVVEPDNLDNIERLKANGTEVYAYISVGEIHPSRTWASSIPKDWLLGENQAWGSRVTNLTKKEWQTFLLTQGVKPLWAKGYRGFFLDTLDSYQLYIKDSTGQLEQQRGLVDIIQNIHQQYPGSKIILNRGFEIIPLVSKQILAVAAESLFQRWDPHLKQYTEVPVADREWLLNKLNQARKQTNLDVIVIDYVEPRNKALARQAADQIKRLGFTPWVANPALDVIGIGSIEIKPKQLLIVYDGKTNKLAEWQASFLVQLMIKGIDLFGYTIDYADIQKGYPEQRLAGQYTYLITLLDDVEPTQQSGFTKWLDSKKAEGIPVLNL